MARKATTCDQCGQTDDHPKVHIGVVTKHHDCLSVAERQLVSDTSPVAEKIIEAAESGTHGDDLVSFIETLAQED
jgi:hypothetical protein